MFLEPLLTNKNSIFVLQLYSGGPTSDSGRYLDALLLKLIATLPADPTFMALCQKVIAA
jgi:hypothetical protein